MAATEISITPVSSKADMAAFVDLVYTANAGDPAFVPQLRAEELEKYTPGGNPFHEHARCQYFLARDHAGTVVGRISAHIDELALAVPATQGMGPGTGMWGALEAVDEGVAQALITRAEEWLREQGMTRVLAPMNLSVWEEPGQLVKGHDHPPTVMMGHQNPKFQPWIEAAGYAPVKSLYTYELDILKEFPPLIQRIVSAGEKNGRIRIREASLKHFDREVEIICHILNDAWSDNWGFVPPTDAEIRQLAVDLKPIAEADLVLFAEMNGEPVGCAVSIPDLNQVLARMNGRLLPTGIWHFLRRRSIVTRGRMLMLGVLPRVRRIGLYPLLIAEARTRGVQAGLTSAEVGWTLEDNEAINAGIEAAGGRRYKTYRLYEKRIA